VTPGQLSLFDDADGVDPAACEDAIRAIGRVLPAGIHLGTSSWSFPGWTGLVYAPRGKKPASEQVLARHGLAAYAQHPLFRTVSLDRTFYAPLTAEEFARYAAQVPDTFRFVVKAPAPRPRSCGPPSRAWERRPGRSCFNSLRSADGSWPTSLGSSRGSPPS
jgi:hypothetical protein